MSIVSSRDPYTSYIWSGGTEAGWRESVDKGFKWEKGAWAYDMDSPAYKAGAGAPGGAMPKSGSGVGGASAGSLSGSSYAYGHDPFDYAAKATKVLNIEFDRTMRRSMGQLNEDVYDRGIGNSPAAQRLASDEKMEIEARRMAAIAGLYKDFGGGGGSSASAGGASGPGPAYAGAYDPRQGFTDSGRGAGKTYYGGRTPEEEEDYQYNKGVEGFKPPAGKPAGATEKAGGEPIRGKGETYDDFMKRWNFWFNSKGGSKVASGVGEFASGVYGGMGSFGF